MQTKRLTTEQFAQREKRGHIWERVICGRLCVAGLEAHTPVEPTEFRPKPEDSYQFKMAFADMWKDTHDIICNGEVIEVKGSNLSFTSPQDYPYRNVLIDSAMGHDKKQDKPFIHITVSFQTGEAMMLPGSTRPNWTRKMCKDRFVGQELKYQCCIDHWLTWNEGIQFIKDNTNSY